MGQAAVGFVQNLNGDREVVWVSGPNAGRGPFSVFAALAESLPFGAENEAPREVVPGVVKRLGAYFKAANPTLDQVKVTRDLPVNVKHTLHIVDFEDGVVSLVHPLDFVNADEYESIVDFEFSEFTNRY